MIQEISGIGRMECVRTNTGDYLEESRESLNASDSRIPLMMLRAELAASTYVDTTLHGLRFHL